MRAWKQRCRVAASTRSDWISRTASASTSTAAPRSGRKRASCACRCSRSSASASAPISRRSSGSSSKLAAEGLFAAERKRPLPQIPATGRARHRQRRSCEARRGRVRDRALPAGAAAGGRDTRPGAVRGSGDRASPRVGRCAARRRRDRARPGRRELRGPAAVQRRAARPSRRRLSRARRVRGRTRAGHATLRPRSRRPRIDADGCRPPRRAGLRRARGDARTTTRGAPARVAGRARPPPRPTRARGRPHAPRRPPAAGAASHGPGAVRGTASRPLATRNPHPWLRHRPQGGRGRARRQLPSRRATAWTSSSPKAASAHGSRRLASDRRGADVRAGRGGAADDRRAAGVRRCRRSTRPSRSGSGAKRSTRSAGNASTRPRARSRSWKGSGMGDRINPVPHPGLPLQALKPSA